LPFKIFTKKERTPEIRFEKVRKRDGRLDKYDTKKIITAIKNACDSSGTDYDGSFIVSDKKYVQWKDYLSKVEEKVLLKVETDKRQKYPNVEQIQDSIEEVLVEFNQPDLAKEFILHRKERTDIREAKSALMEAVREIIEEPHKDNSNTGRHPSARMLQIGEAASTKYHLDRMMPERFSKAHREGRIHIHDASWPFTSNCLQIPFKELLMNGFMTSLGGRIRPPKRPYSAFALAAIIIQANQVDQFGGQSYSHFDRDMAEVLRTNGISPSSKELYQGVEGFIYNLNSMHSRAGAQVPFSSINIGADTTELGRAITLCILYVMEKGMDGTTFIFPNTVFRLKKGINMEPGDPNYDLFEIACRVSARRFWPTYSFMDASFNIDHADEASYMGCRTRVLNNRFGENTVGGRGNVSFTTINLPRVVIGLFNDELFYKQLDKIMDLAAEQLAFRFEMVSKMKKKDFPFMFGQHLYQGSEDLNPNDEIREALKNGTQSMGFVGLAEAVKLLMGKHHGEDEGALEMAEHVVKHMRKNIDGYSDKYNLNFSLMATPAESTAGRFANIDKEKFGEIKGITDKGYYTNSFHVPVDHKISIVDKMRVEGRFHKYCNGGHISYIEFDTSPMDNPEAVMSVVRIMSQNDVGYGAINYNIAECRQCGTLVRE